MNVMEQVLREKIDPALSAENLGILGSRALGRKVKAAGAEVLTGGCWNRVVGVSFENEPEDLVFKINPEPHNRGIEREFAVLRRFAEDTEMPVPVPRLLDTSGRTIPGSVLVMDRIPGRVLHQTYGFLGRRQKEDISEQLGHFVGRLHERRGKAFGGVELGEDERIGAWPDFWLPRFDSAVREISGSGLLPKAFLEEIAAVRPRLPAILEIGVESTLTHYDIWSGNVMAKGGRITGFIDIPGYWADYARELSFMEMFGMADDRFYGVYRTYRSPDEGFTLRKNIYNLKMHIRHICMYPDQSTYRQGARACLAYIRRSIG